MRRLYCRRALPCHDARVRQPGAAAHFRLAVHASRKVTIGLRREDLAAAADGRTGPALAGDVDLVEALARS